MKKRNIAYIIEAGIFSGMPLGTLSLCTGIHEHGVPVICIYAAEHEGFDEFVKKYEFPTYKVSLRRIRKTLNPLKLARSLFYFLPDIIGIVRILKREHITELHNYGPHQIFGPIAATLLGLPVIWYIGTILRTAHPIMRWVMYFYMNLMATKVVANCEAVKKDAIDGNRFLRKKIVIIPNLVDTKKYTPSTPSKENMQKLGATSKTKIIMLVATIYPLKGIDVFVRIANELQQDHGSDFKFLIIGHEMDLHREYYRSIIEMIKQFGLEKKLIIDQGRVETIDYSAASILVIASHTEGSPAVALEAMACGIPVVAAEVGGIPEIIQHGVNGFLFPRGDHRAAAEMVRKALSDEAIYAAIRAKALHDVATKYTSSIVTQQVIDLLDNRL
jgi:glycosyltransferase involved in cell wall biosynthesis